MAGRLFSEKKGFTLVEILVSLAISGVILVAITTVFRTQNKTYTAQDQIRDMQQNLRVAMEVMQRELRMAGLDPYNSGLFGITDITTRDADNEAHPVTSPPAGYSSIRFSANVSNGKTPAPPKPLAPPNNGPPDANETITYRIYDFPVAAGGDGILDLGRDDGGIDLLAENIECMGLAFAYDSDDNGRPEMYADSGGLQRIIWAYDSDNDNRLDRNIDANLDGVINALDAAGFGTNGVINSAVNVGSVVIKQIYAIRIWLLAKSSRQEAGFIDRDTYTCGRQVVAPAAIADEQNNGGFRRFLLESTVVVRNMAI
jgi:type IV pilus assembly protein PilW